MKSLKLKLFEYRNGLNIEQNDVSNIVTVHMEACDKFSEKEIFNSLNENLEIFKYYENVTSFLTEIDEEISNNSLVYTLKDLHRKISRKPDRFIYETTLTSLIQCINQENDDDRKIKIMNDLTMHEWIPEIKSFLSEMATTPQAKMNFISKGGVINDVYSIVLEKKEGFLTYVNESWYLMNDSGVTGTLLENHISDDEQLRKMRLLEEAIKRAVFTENKITFKIAENFSISFDTNNKKIFLNDTEKENSSTLETIFQSPYVPFMGKGFYPILNECYNNLDKFMVIDSVKHIYNVGNSAFECYVFNYNENISQLRIDKRSGTSYYTFENALPLIENVMHELGTDITFFYENLLNAEQAKKNKLEKEEKVLLEKLKDIENAIMTIKKETNLITENKTIEKLYNDLLIKKHKVSERIKTIKNEKSVM
jgi:hypothetical protein